MSRSFGLVSFGDGDEGAEAFVGFATAHGDTSVFLQFSEEVLDQVPPFGLARLL
jgi:hypothetical protein